MDISRALAVEGWMDPPELEYLARLSFSLPAGSVIAEVGSYKGRSANALALNSSVTLYCVDPWSKYSFADFTAAYGEFLQNTADLPNVIPVRKPSVEAAAEFAAKGMLFDAIFLDGDHEEAFVRADIEAWRPLLKPGGVLAGHDYGRPDWPAVEVVVKELVPRFRVIPQTSIWTTEERIPLFIPYVNRPDLLREAVSSAVGVDEVEVILINNSGQPLALDDAAVVQLPITPSFAQTQNWILNEAVVGNHPFYLWMHSDAHCDPSVLRALVANATGCREKWGVLFTAYDALSAVNTKAMAEIGGWDTNLPWYYSDNDVYRRMKLAGYGCFDTGLAVFHEPSQTLKADPMLQRMNHVLFPLWGEYYRYKWGGTPGQERFASPFGWGIFP